MLLPVSAETNSIQVRFGPQATIEIVSFPDPTMHVRKGSGDIGADIWFCKLSSHVIVCIGLYWSTCSHMMVHKTKKTLQCPQTLSSCGVVGSGNEITIEMYKV